MICESIVAKTIGIIVIISKESNILPIACKVGKADSLAFICKSKIIIAAITNNIKKGIGMKFKLITVGFKEAVIVAFDPPEDPPELVITVSHVLFAGL